MTMHYFTWGITVTYSLQWLNEVYNSSVWQGPPTLIWSLNTDISSGSPLSLNLSNRPRSGHPRYKRIILRPKRTSRKIPLRLQSQSNLSNYLMEQEDSPWKISLTPDDPSMTGRWQELVSSEVTCCRKILPSSIYDNKSALISKKKKK